MKLIVAKCPSCGAKLDVLENQKTIICEYCKQTILLENESLANSELKVSIEGLKTDKELITSANQLLEMGEFLKSKKLFLEFAEKNPNDYHGWLGLLISRTRNFTIRDNNALFENDIQRFNKNFRETATVEALKKYGLIIDNYFNPLPKVVQVVKKEVKEKKQNQKNIISKTIEVIIGCYVYIFGAFFETIRSMFGKNKKENESKEEKSDLDTDNVKKKKKIKQYIFPVFFGIAFIAYIETSVLTALVFLLLALSLLPEAVKFLKDKKIKPWAVSLILFIVALVVTPPSFIGSYENEELGYTFTFNEEDAVLIFGEEVLTGTLTYEYENSYYYIEILTEDRIFYFEYSSDESNQIIYITDEEYVLFKKDW